MEIIIDVIVIVLIYTLFFFRKWRREGKDILLVNTLMYVYLAFVLYFTLMPIIASLPFIFDHSYIPMNLEPFIDVSLSRGDFIRQIVLNIVMTIPFGFQFPLVSRKKPNFLRTIAFTFLLSFAIEITQPLLSSTRSSDITDIINNVLGGAIGYLLYLVFRPVTQKILRSLKDKPAPTKEAP